MVFLEDLAFAICDKIASTISCEPKQFSLNFKGERSWKNKILSRKSAHHTLQGVFVAFSLIYQKTSLSVVLLSPPELHFQLSYGRAALSWVKNRLCFLLFCQASVFISERGTSTGGKRGLRPHSSHLCWLLSGALCLGSAGALSGSWKGSLAGLADTDTVVQEF